MAPRPLWAVPRDWPGETVFVVAGGASVLGQDLSLLAGRRVIAIKSSWRRVPQADVLYYADAKWWSAHGAATRDFAGVICTSSDAGDERVRFLARHTPGKGKPMTLAIRPDAVAVNHTSLTAAINIAVHYGAGAIALLGADNGPAAPGGRVYHHEHPCNPPKDDRWALQRADLASVATHLRELGIPVSNTSPVSRLGFWPHRPLEECLCTDGSASG